MIMSFLDLNIPGHESFSEDVNVPVPGGLSERPSGAPKDVSITAGKTEISQETYNKIIGQLQHSFKEAYEILGDMANFTIVAETTEEREDKIFENAIDEALMTVFESGPIFEAVKRSDKNDVKTIVKSLRPKIEADLKDEKGIHFYKPSLCARTLGGIGTYVGAGAVGTAAVGASLVGALNPLLAAPISLAAGATALGSLTVIAGAINQIWKTRLWQVIGIVNLESGNISSVTKELTAKYAEDLDGYKILAAQAVPTIRDIFKNKFGWKNQKKTYFILVDKKIPEDLKTVQDAFENAVKKTEESDKKEEESGVKTESAEVFDNYFEDYEEILEEFLIEYIEAANEAEGGDPLNEPKVKKAVQTGMKWFNVGYEELKKSGVKNVTKQQFLTLAVGLDDAAGAAVDKVIEKHKEKKAARAAKKNNK